MTPETYARTFGEEPDNLTVYARHYRRGERSALSSLCGATGAVDTVAFNDEVIDSLQADAALGEHGRGGALWWRRPRSRSSCCTT